jgi:DNA polymerase-3 subunit gamma/tau
MERYIVSARKYRPQTFESVVGQRHITDTLNNALQNNHLAQALLFCGPRGVGKTTCARILAKKINESDQVSEEDFDLNIFELDAASNNSVDDIRRLIDQVRFAPQVGRFKVYIIDEVHMLSQSAFNAFLKTLEEPPAHAIFILATTEKHKIIPTILSRCQIFDFKRITVEDIAEHLAFVAKEENITADPEALHIIAQKADGALRDALSIFDRLVSFSGANITYQGVITNLDILDYDYFFKATDLALNQDLLNLMLLLHEILDKGFEANQFVNGWATHLRDLLVSFDPQTIELLEVGPSIKQRYLEQSKKCSIPFIISALRFLNDCDVRYKSATNQRLLVEVTLMEISTILEKKTANVTEAPAIQPKTEIAQKPKPVQIITIAPGVAEPKPETFAPKPQPALTAEAVAPPPAPPPPPVVQVPITPHPVAPPHIKPAEKPTENPAPAPPAGDWMQRLKGRSISIKTETEKAEDSQTADNQEEEIAGPENVFSDAEFETAWKAFLKEIETRKSIVGVLQAHKPTLKNLFELHFELANKTQEGYLQSIQQELLAFLRKSLNNFSLSIHVTIKEGTTEKRPYTAEERYRAMLEINPALDKLRQAFDTDIE